MGLEWQNSASPSIVLRFFKLRPGKQAYVQTAAVATFSVLHHAAAHMGKHLESKARKHRDLQTNRQTNRQHATSQTRRQAKEQTEPC